MCPWDIIPTGCPSVGPANADKYDPANGQFTGSDHSTNGGSAEPIGYSEPSKYKFVQSGNKTRIMGNKPMIGWTT